MKNKTPPHPTRKTAAPKQPARREIVVNVDTYGKLLQKDGAVSAAKQSADAAIALFQGAVADLNDSVGTLLSMKGINGEFKLEGVEVRATGPVVIVTVTPS